MTTLDSQSNKAFSTPTSTAIAITILPESSPHATTAAALTPPLDDIPRAVVAADEKIPRDFIAAIDETNCGLAIVQGQTAALPLESPHNIADPIEGHDSDFDVELSSSSSTKSMLIEDPLLAATFDHSHQCRAPTTYRASLYGKVVKSIQKSIRRLFHCGRADDSQNTILEGGAPSVQLKQPSRHDSVIVNHITSVEPKPIHVDTATAPTPPTLSPPHLVNPITSSSMSSPSLQQTQAIHKTLLIDMSFTRPLLPPLVPDLKLKKCLVLDLDETLVHSTFQPVPNPDLVVPVHLGEGIYQPIYVCKRPGVDEFLRSVLEHFEVVVFTASLSNYADPVIDFLDPIGGIRFRLYREDCLQFQGMYIKDLSRLGRDLEQVLIIDNSPASYSMQPQNALGCRSWFKDPFDRELQDRLLPMLLRLSTFPSVSTWRTEHLELIETPYTATIHL